MTIMEDSMKKNVRVVEDPRFLPLFQYRVPIMTFIKSFRVQSGGEIKSNLHTI